MRKNCGFKVRRAKNRWSLKGFPRSLGNFSRLLELVSMNLRLKSFCANKSGFRICKTKFRSFQRDIWRGLSFWSSNFIHNWKIPRNFIMMWQKYQISLHTYVYRLLLIRSNHIILCYLIKSKTKKWLLMIYSIRTLNCWCNNLTYKLRIKMSMTSSCHIFGLLNEYRVDLIL